MLQLPYESVNRHGGVLMKKIFLTCEHGGAEIPVAYRKLFQKHRRVLTTHRALDIGALAVAFALKKMLRVPLRYSVVSRLVVDLNRFPRSATLFSEFTNGLSATEKSQIIRRYYQPHWNRITQAMQIIARRKNTIVHIAVHSMTDQLHGQVRPMQLALLYNPRRPGEKKFATLWIRELRKHFPHFKIARNNPYKGDGEGLTSFLRSLIRDPLYVGIELEMNQAFLKTLKTTQAHKEFSRRLAVSLQAAVDEL